MFFIYLNLVALYWTGCFADISNNIEDRSFFEDSSLENLQVSMTKGEIRGFYSSKEIDQLLNTYASNFGEIVQQLVSIGKTYNGEDIWAIQIAKEYNSSRLNVDYLNDSTGFEDATRLLEESGFEYHYQDISNTTVPDESRRILSSEKFSERPTLVITGLHRGMEFISSTMIVYLAKRLIYAYVNNLTSEDANLNYLMETKNIWLIPIVNKDTYDAITAQYMTNNTLNSSLMKNRDTSTCSTGYSGVNLRLNYPLIASGAEAITNECSQLYGGTVALSEPETQAIDAFIKNMSVNLMLNIGATTSSGTYIYLPFSYLQRSNILTSDYKAAGDDVAFSSLFSSFSSASQFKIVTNYQLYGNGSAGEISDYMYHINGVRAFTLEIGSPPFTVTNSDRYFLLPNDMISVLNNNLPFFEDMMYRVGPMLFFTTIYQKIEACGMSHTTIIDCSEDNDFIYSGKFSINNTGLADGGTQQILIMYSPAVSITNISFSLTQSQNYVFSDTSFTPVNFSTQKGINGLMYIQIEIPSVAQKSSGFFGIVGSLKSPTISNAYISFRVLYYDSGHGLEYYQDKIENEGSIIEPPKPNVPVTGIARARLAQDVIVGAYFGILGLTLIGVGIRFLIVRMINKWHNSH